MKLKIAGIESEVDLNNHINVLEIENKKLFKNVITELNNTINYKEKEKNIILVNDETAVEMYQNMQIIIDPFNIDFNSKEILGKLYTKLDNINSLEENINDDYIRIINDLLTYARSLVNDLPFDCNVEEKINFKDVLKMASLKIDIEQYEKLEEKIMFLIDLTSEFELPKVIIFVNIKQYFTNEELEIIYKYSISKEVGLILLENIRNEKLQFENKIVIDNDFDDFLE